MSTSINRLTRELRDLNPETRSKAAMNLGEMGAAEALPSLVSAFKKDQDETVRSVIAETLALFGTHDVVIPALIFAKDNDESERVRTSAEWALGQVAKARGHASTKALLDDFQDKEKS